MSSTYDTIRFNGTISTGTKSGVYGTANTTQLNVKFLLIFTTMRYKILSFRYIFA